MFAPEEIIVIQEDMLPFSVSINIPDVPDFGDFEEMPRGHPILKKHLADHLGNEEESHSPDTMSIEEAEQEEDDEHQDYIVIEVMEGYHCTICIAGMNEDEIEEEIEKAREEIVDLILDGHDNIYD
jgi:hypothetical protein